MLGIGDTEALSAAKIMWLMHENPDIDIAALAAGGEYPQMGKKAKHVLVTTAVESGCECTPYAEVIDDKTGKKICLHSYNLLPRDWQSLMLITPMLCLLTTLRRALCRH